MSEGLSLDRGYLRRRRETEREAAGKQAHGGAGLQERQAVPQYLHPPLVLEPSSPSPSLTDVYLFLRMLWTASLDPFGAESPSLKIWTQLKE